MNTSSQVLIRVKETLTLSLSDRIGECKILSDRKGCSLIKVDIPDQPALRGILNQLWDMNLTILAVSMTRQEEVTAFVPRRFS